jgi:flagellar protein FlaF
MRHRPRLHHTEATISQGAARYRQASRDSVPARETEIAAFRAVIRALDSAHTEDDRIRSFGRNHDLWSMLVKDLSMDGNKLPPALKTQLIALGLWSMQYSTLAILQKLSAEPLIAVNRNIVDGLAEQAAQPQATTIASVETAI